MMSLDAASGVCFMLIVIYLVIESLDYVYGEFLDMIIRICNDGGSLD